MPLAISAQVPITVNVRSWSAVSCGSTCILRSCRYYSHSWQLHCKPRIDDMDQVCSACGKSFCTDWAMISHWESKESCVRDLNSKQWGILQQVNYDLRKKKPYWCPQCPYRTDKWDALCAHCNHCGKSEDQMWQAYVEQKPFPCSTCGKRFASAHPRDCHEWQCGKSEEEKDAETRTEKPYQCMRCGKRFVAEDGLNNHMWHCGYTEEEKIEFWKKCFPYSCQCGKRFADLKGKGGLENHQVMCAKSLGRT